MRNGAALLEVSAGCNADCLFCLRNESGRGRAPLPEQADIPALAFFLTLARRLGLRRLLIGGDEPTVLGPGPLESMLARARAAGFSDIALFSNAILLGKASFRRRLVAAGVTSFHLPLYGPEASVHDAVTQRKGSFQSLSRAVADLRGRARTELHSVVLRQNQRRLGEMRALAARWGVGLLVQSLQRRGDPVGYEDLAPAAGPAGRRPRPAATRPESKGEGPQLRFNVLLGRLNFSDQGSPLLTEFLRAALRGLGAPAPLREGVLRRYERKPSFRDPERFLRLLDLLAARRFDDAELALYHPADAASALALGLRTRDRRAFEDALLFRDIDEASLRAKARARAELEGACRR
ncbi:MAG: radical SAM protein [Elusimicrobiota bacterium]